MWTPAAIVGIVLAGAASAASTGAQQSLASPRREPRPSFEVATVRASKPGTFRSDMDESANRLTLQNYTLRHLIREAYGLKSDAQISGGPDWMDKRGFDIVAKVGDDEVTRMDKMNGEQSDRDWDLMLQSLLADRFQLKVTQEDRMLPIFALVVSRSGAKIKRTSPNATNGDPGFDINWGELTATAATMDAFADVLSGMRDMSSRVVINRTGLAGNFDFKMDWARDRGDGASQDSPFPGLFTALQEQLGLRLKPARASVPVVIVESAAEPQPN